MALANLSQVVSNPNLAVDVCVFYFIFNAIQLDDIYILSVSEVHYDPHYYFESIFSPIEMANIILMCGHA